MELKSSTDDPIPTLQAFGAEVLARRAIAEARSGPFSIPRNAGARRTESKLALLNAIKKVGGVW